MKNTDIYKRTCFLLGIAALAVSCSGKLIEDHEEIPVPEGYYAEDISVVYPPLSKVSFGETSGAFSWTEGDEIAFHLSDGTYITAPVNLESNMVRLFIPEGVVRDNYAVYPASIADPEHASLSDMRINLPDSYDISSDLMSEYVPVPMIAVNDPSSNRLSFKHAGGLLQVNLAVPAGTRTVAMTLGKSITGTFQVDEERTISARDNDEDCMTFIVSGSGLGEDTAIKLLAPVPTGTYDHIGLLCNDGMLDRFSFAKDVALDFVRAEGKKVCLSEGSFEDLADYFWFEALDAGSTVTFTENYPVTLYFSTDGKKTFHEWDKTEVSLENVGDRVYFYGTSGAFGKYASSGSKFNRFSGSGRLATGGELIRLKNKEGGEMEVYSGPDFAKSDSFGYIFTGFTSLVDASRLVMPKVGYGYCFERMFSGCTSLLYPPELPSPELSSGCYFYMFSGCTSLVTAPELPSTEMKNSCYLGMFNGCTSLITPPELPAMSLAYRCYYQMFSGCTALLSTPELRAEQMYEECYDAMFSGCTSLTSCTALPATALANSCYNYMFNGCTALKKAMETLPATTLYPQCYYYMFYGCSSLETAPDIEAEEVRTVSNKSDRNCEAMFMRCSSLVKAPSRLRIKSPSRQCYYQMFAGCTSLVESPDIEATDITTYACLQFMFRECPSLSRITVHFTKWGGAESGGQAWWVSGSLGSSASQRIVGTNAEGIFVKPAELESKFGYSFIPTGWEVEELDEEDE